MADQRDDTDAKGATGSIRLSAPWRETLCEFESDASSTVFVTARTELHRAFIHEEQKTKRLGLCLASGLLMLACLIPVFAPAGRETISYWIGLALFVFAAGAMGYTNLNFKSDNREMQLSKDRLES